MKLKDLISEMAYTKIKPGKYATVYKVKEDMAEGNWDPENPQVHVVGLGVYNLKLLENVITRDLTRAAKDLGSDRGAKNLNYHLFEKNSPLGSKIKGLWEVYQQMNSSQYKRNVTVYKKR